MAKTNRPKLVVYLDDEAMKKDLEKLASIRSRSASNLLVSLAKTELELAKRSGELLERYATQLD